jgi:hypothetical protein
MPSSASHQPSQSRPPRSLLHLMAGAGAEDVLQLVQRPGLVRVVGVMQLAEHFVVEAHQVGRTPPPCAMNFSSSVSVRAQDRIYGGGFAPPTAKVDAALDGDGTPHAIEIGLDLISGQSRLVREAFDAQRSVDD